MTPPPRMAPLLAQYDFARRRLEERMTGPSMDSGDGEVIQVPPLTDEEYFWEPVPGSWSVRPRLEQPAQGATLLAGAGDWRRDGGRPHPWPPPFTTIAWRLSHLSEMLTLRADHTIGTHVLTAADFRSAGNAVDAVKLFDAAAAQWRAALRSADEEALDTVGHCTYPGGSDAEEPFLDVVWWVNQEVLHHGAEIALLRDLHAARHHGHS